MASYREVGGQLGAYIRANNPSTQQIQALLSDLLAGDQLLTVMSEVVRRPIFKRLATLAGSGTGDKELIGLKSEISNIYTLYTVQSIIELLSGMLDRAEIPKSTALVNKKYTSKTEERRDFGEAVIKHLDKCSPEEAPIYEDEMELARASYGYELIPANSGNYLQATDKQNDREASTDKKEESDTWYLILGILFLAGYLEALSSFSFPGLSLASLGNVLLVFFLWLMTTSFYLNCHTNSRWTLILVGVGAMIARFGDIVSSSSGAMAVARFILWIIPCASFIVWYDFKSTD